MTPSPQPLSHQGRGAKMDSRFRENDGVWKIFTLTNNLGIRMVLTVNPLLPRLRWFKKLGDFERGLSKLRDKPRFVWFVRASSAATNFLKQRRKQAAGGVFLFGYFILDKQNKVSRLRAKKNITYGAMPFNYCARWLNIHTFSITTLPSSTLRKNSLIT